MLEVAKPINNIIHNNQKIEETLNGEDTQNIISKKEGETIDNSFNQLLALQLLIQKQSGLKELCKFYYI